MSSHGFLHKWRRLLKMINQNGGLRSSMYKLWRFDTLKDGQLVGIDYLGNKYYEYPGYMLGRSRWVEYNVNVKWEYDASQVCPEWYGWLHYKTDRLPSEDPAKYRILACPWHHCWLLPYEENVSGTAKAFYPYTTTRPNVAVWDGQSICDKISG